MGLLQRPQSSTLLCPHRAGRRIPGRQVRNPLPDRQRRLAERGAAVTGPFVLQHTTLRAASAVPEVVLHQADDAITLWERTELAAGGAQLPPPFWAFAWAGGQAVARYLLDHPDTVRGRRVLDLAAGGGVVAIAADSPGPARSPPPTSTRRRSRRSRSTPPRTT